MAKRSFIIGTLLQGDLDWRSGSQSDQAHFQTQPPSGKTYFPVVEQDFAKVRADDQAAKPTVMQRQRTLLSERYDLANRPAQGVMMSGARKAVQQGVRVKLHGGVTWEQLAAMSADEIREKDLLPRGF